MHVSLSEFLIMFLRKGIAGSVGGNILKCLMDNAKTPSRSNCNFNMRRLRSRKPSFCVCGSFYSEKYSDKKQIYTFK